MRKNLSYRIKYFILGIFLFPIFARINFIGSGHADDYYRYIAPLIIGSIAGFLIGKMKDRWVSKTKLLEKEIEKRKIIEKELISQRESLTVTLRSIGDGVITTDLKGKIVLINKITEEQTGWSQKEAFGKQIQEVFKIINEKTGEPCENPVEKVLSTKKIISLANHTVLIAKDGTRLAIEDSGAPIFDNESKIIGTVLVYRDVTEKKRTAEKLIKIEKLESIGILAGGIAHDFNNILSAILGNIELAKTYTDSTNRAFPLLEEAKKASIRAKDLTNQLLTFSKGGIPVKQTSSIKQIITDSANFVLHGSSVICSHKIPEDLWQADIDASQISQVIQNIIINACHSMPKGGVINILCENISNTDKETLLSPDQKYIKISISDSGCGIQKKNINKIFDPYFSTKEEGSGLGLAICHSIISQHEGSISVQSEINRGTTFTIYLPASTEGTQNTISTDYDTNKNNHHAKIMIMDDEKMIRDVAKQMLEQFGHKVLSAKDGNEAIRIYKEHFKNNYPIDVIIMDLTIREGMGGKDAVRKILQINPEAKIIVASGYSNDPIMSNYKDYGFEASIAKPFQLMTLNNLIQSILK